MSKDYNTSKFSDIVELLLPTKITWEEDGKVYTIDEWRENAVNEVKNYRSKTKIEIFNVFTAALLQGFRTKGKDFGPRIERMNNSFRDFVEIMETKVQQLLREEGYSLLKRGVNVVLRTKEIVEPPSFDWAQYFQKAEQNYEDGYKNDRFLAINGVGPKVRDFALSLFSPYWCAIDSRLSQVIERTGLFPNEKRDYESLQRLIIQLSKETGYFPKEIDRIIWFFGQGICKGKPKCENCPITNLCLTYRNKRY